MSIYNGGRRLPPLPSDANGYPTSDPFATGAGAAANAIASGLNPTTPPPFITKGPSTNSPGSNVSGQPWPTTAPPATPSATPGSPSTPGQWGGTHYSTAAGSAAKWNADGSYTLPSGETLGAGNTFTLGVGGQQVRVAGNYNGSNQALWQNNGVGETAMDRFSRRLNDLAATGANVNDPNVQYDTMARVRDDASAALQQRLGRPPTAQELQQATGFAHIDRFVRGANGETGFQGAATSGGSASGAPASDAAWKAAISSATGNPSTSPNPSTAGAPPVSAQTNNPADPYSAAGGGGANPAQYAAGTQAPPPQSASQNGQPNYNGGSTSLTIMDSPQLAYDAMLRRMNIDPTAHGMFTDYLRQRLQGAVQSMLQVAQKGGNFDLNAALDNIGQHAFGQAGNFANYAGQVGDQGLGALSDPANANASFKDISPYIQNMIALKSMNMNPLGQSSTLNNWGDFLSNYQNQTETNNMVEPNGGHFLPYLMGTDYFKHLTGLNR